MKTAFQIAVVTLLETSFLVGLFSFRADIQKKREKALSFF